MEDNFKDEDERQQAYLVDFIKIRKRIVESQFRYLTDTLNELLSKNKELEKHYYTGPSDSNWNYRLKDKEITAPNPERSGATEAKSE